MHMVKLVIIASLFDELDTDPIKKLQELGIDVKFTPNQDINDEDKIAKMIGNAEGAIVGADKIGKKVFDNCPNLKMVSIRGGSFNNIDVELAHELGIEVMNIPGVNSQGIAEMAWTLLMATDMNPHQSIEEIEKVGIVTNEKGIQNDMCGKTVGIIGFGVIGRAMAKIASRFDMKILVFEPAIQLDEIVDVGYQANLVSIDRLLTDSDFIIFLSSRDNPNTHIINNQMLDKMKDGVVVTYVGYDQIIGGKALYNALESGKVRAAGLDISGQSIVALKELITLDNVCTTPSIYGQMIESSEMMDLFAIQNAINFFQQE